MEGGFAPPPPCLFILILFFLPCNTHPGNEMVKLYEIGSKLKTPYGNAVVTDGGARTNGGEVSNGGEPNNLPPRLHPDIFLIPS